MDAQQHTHRAKRPRSADESGDVHRPFAKLQQFVSEDGTDGTAADGVQHGIPREGMWAEVKKVRERGPGAYAAYTGPILVELELEYLAASQEVDPLADPQPVEYGRSATTSDDTELTQLTTDEPVGAARKETSPAVSPVDEMVGRLDGVAAFRKLDANITTPAPRCAFRPCPHRHEELRQEVGHMTQKASHERAQLFSDCTHFDKYLYTVQHGSLDANRHRRKVFEWNLAMADDLRLSNRALHLSFNYFDRFLSRMECEERNLQLVSTACMWVAAKVDAGTTVAASQLETLVGIENKHILEMERCLLSVLRWQVQPVTTFDMARLLVPFMFCEREHRDKLEQVIENLTLAQALVYPLLKYEPAVLAVTAVVCGSTLISSAPQFDDYLINGLTEVAGVSAERTRECRREVEEHINLMLLMS